MPKAAFLLALFFVCLAMPGPARSQAPPGSAENSRVQELHYEAIPNGRAEKKEKVTMVITETPSGLDLLSRGFSMEKVEEVSFHMDREGNFISGNRLVVVREDEQAHQESIWKNGSRVFYERDGKIRNHDLPPDKPLAVGESLLVRLRFFPFDGGKEWRLFMVDFSGTSVTVTIRQAARETVAVPAGVFECYRMETVVDIPILRPKITFWLAVKPPHVMVRHEGKRGPFSPSYRTSLISLQ